MSTRTAVLALSAWLAGLAAAGTGPAVAATSASIIPVNDKSVLSISAAAGESNDITISETIPLSPDVKRLAVSDAADTVTPGPGCVAVEGGEVRCRYEGVAAIWVDAGDLDDVVTKWTPITGWLRGGGGDDTLRGGPANDANYLDGEAGDDTVIGGPHRDELDGGPGADVLDGGGGTADRASYAIRTGRVDVTLDDVADDGAAASLCLAGGGSCGTYAFERDNVRPTVEYVIGGSGNDTLTGHAGANGLAGGPGADTLNGLGGNDTLRGDQGNDVYNGGDGRDTLVSTLDDGADVFNGGSGAWDRVTYAGRTAPVVVDVDGNDDDGADGEADNVKTDVEQVAGGNGDDRLTGNAGPDVLFGGPGSDELFGLGGVDLLVGEHDATVAQVGDGSPGDDVLHGGADADSLDGGPGDDTLNAEAGDDRLVGGSGADVLQGGDGRDLADYGARTTRVTVTIDGSAGDGATGEGDDVRADVEDLAGGSGNDILEGSDAGNRLLGGAGIDVLRGLGDNDEISGGPNADVLVGGLGNDVLRAVDGVSGNDASNGSEGLDSCASDPGDEEASCG